MDPVTPPDGGTALGPPEGADRPARADVPVPGDVPAPPEPSVAPDSVRLGDDGLLRCWWGTSAPEYVEYHDEEWGRPLHGDDALFERLCLEAFQSGLSWLTILRKRPAFRRAFDGFSIDIVAGYGPDDVDRLMADAAIVRNRAKIEAALHNARVAADLPIGLDELLWSFAPAVPPARPTALGDYRAITPESTAMAKDLKRRGFKFVGPTTAYALMQATGMVDDHVALCWRATAADTTAS